MSRFLRPSYLATALLLVGGFVLGSWALRTDQSHAVRPGDVVVLGDSITAHGTDALHDLHPDWEINGVSGRLVSTLPRLIRERLQRGEAPSVVVVALGSNAVPHWDADDHRHALDLLPPETAVVLVTTWRDPRLWTSAEAFHHRAAVQAEYTGWMHTLAEERPATCLVDWRTTARSRPELLSDGVHTNEAGREVWARMISEGVARCQHAHD